MAPDGRYVVFKLEENGRYGLGSYYRGFGNCFLLTKYLSNFIPFGSAIVNLQKPLINIDPTSNFDVLFDSDCDNWKVNESVFDDKIMGRKQLLFIIEDDHCEKFGYFLNT